jgi:hypothetical protein
VREVSAATLARRCRHYGGKSETLDQFAPQHEHVTRAIVFLIAAVRSCLRIVLLSYSSIEQHATIPTVHDRP